MKVGYPDTINSGNSSASPFKMVDKSKADLDKDGKVSEYEGNRAEAAFGTPLNMKMPGGGEDDKKESTRSSDLIGQHRADNTIADFKNARIQADTMAKQKEAAIRKKQGTTSTPTSAAPKKKTKVGKAVSKISKAVSNISKNIKEKKTQRKAKKDFIAESKISQTAYMKKKAADKKAAEDSSYKDIKMKKVDYGSNKELIAKIQKGPPKKNVPLKMKDKKAQAVRKADEREALKASLKVKTAIPVPIKFANAAQRKAVWASKNEKKKKK